MSLGLSSLCVQVLGDGDDHLSYRGDDSDVSVTSEDGLLEDEEEEGDEEDEDEDVSDSSDSEGSEQEAIAAMSLGSEYLVDVMKSRKRPAERKVSNADEDLEHMDVEGGDTSEEEDGVPNRDRQEGGYFPLIHNRVRKESVGSVGSW